MSGTRKAREGSYESRGSGEGNRQGTRIREGRCNWTGCAGTNGAAAGERRETRASAGRGEARAHAGEGRSEGGEGLGEGRCEGRNLHLNVNFGNKRTIGVIIRTR